MWVHFKWRWKSSKGEERFKGKEEELEKKSASRLKVREETKQRNHGSKWYMLI